MFFVFVFSLGGGGDGGRGVVVSAFKSFIPKLDMVTSICPIVCPRLWVEVTQA